MADREYVRSLMHPVTEPGKIAGWIAPPPAGIKGKPFEFEYVRL
jgi:benzoyl-CoA 2,3-dioxygenase component B